MGCTCQDCGKKYTIDVSVPDKVWEIITPKSGGAGMLCVTCIVKRCAEHKLGDVPVMIHAGK